MSFLNFLLTAASFPGYSSNVSSKKDEAGFSSPKLPKADNRLFSKELAVFYVHGTTGLFFFGRRCAGGESLPVSLGSGLLTCIMSALFAFDGKGQEISP